MSFQSFSWEQLPEVLRTLVAWRNQLERKHKQRKLTVLGIPICNHSAKYAVAGGKRAGGEPRLPRELLLSQTKHIKTQQQQWTQGKQQQWQKQKASLSPFQLLTCSEPLSLLSHFDIKI